METKRAFDRCKTCGEYDHTDTHRCLPVWVVSWEEDEDDREVRARDAEQATERFAEQSDDYDSDWSRGERTVWVRKPGEKPVAYAVETETVVQYSAREVT